MDKLDCIIYTASKNDEGIIRIFKDYNIFTNEQNIEFDILLNSDYDIYRNTEFPDGFLYFKYRIEIYSTSTVVLDVRIENISTLLLKLWEHMIPSIAVCDYENLLPNAGGYRSQEVPWPKLG